MTKRHPGTCQWLLDHESYRSWKTQRNSLFWLYGTSGCGKTILASSTIQQLREGDNVLLFFYFNVNEENKRTLSQMLRTLIFQAQSQAEVAEIATRKLYASCLNGKRQPTPSELLACCNHIMEQLDRVTLVIDALDECEASKELVDWLKNLHSSNLEGLHLLVTSRREMDPELLIGTWPDNAHCETFLIQNHHMNKDIRSYVCATIHADDEFKEWNHRTALRSKVEKKVLEKSSGM